MMLAPYERLLQKANGLLRLIRPELPLAAALCVVIGEVLALGTLPPLRAAVLGALCGFFLSASAMASNDYFDLEVDRINAPERPLPAGLVSTTDAIILTIVAGLAGLAAAWALDPAAFVAGVIVWGIGFLYNWRLKAAGLWGNLMVSTSVAATFLMGGLGVGRLWSGTVWLFSLIAFTFDLAEEIAGDAMDAEGDRKRGSRSIALTQGRETALRISGSLFILVILLTLVPIVFGALNLHTLVIIFLTDGLVLFFLRRMLKSRTPAEGRSGMRGMYLSASLGFLAFLIGLVVMR